MASSLMRLINRLLPFATPGTPLVQDLVHLGVICVLLYFAPQIQEYIQQRRESQLGNAQAVPAVVRDTPETHHEEQHVDNQQHDNAEVGGEDVEQDPLPANDRPGNADFQAFQRDQINDANGAGPANAEADGMPTQRNVGAKKAKSLARRDQRRAYHEFQRAQGEAQRAKDAEGASEREAAQAAERERRRAVEAELEAKKAKEREKKREQERRDREEEQARRERTVNVVRRGLAENRMCNIFDVIKEVGGAEIDELWVERILNANGMLGKKEDGSFTMVTGTGWIVKVSSEEMRKTYERSVEDGLGDEDGKIGFEELGTVLEQVLKTGQTVAAH
ncbi:hypothetical protein M409DRAFT_56040 [Zasmidium cellare ATCC 36951]|uniref:Uncharacterized protein n=1 Tax=Zasmidium cellare ATCC 36951 TaxID=1080233 RepID=A0A6A6CG65_ZASCE|nr:uncharacterized protein M409DRAFT_56040 [Zasmidium cellare ATCC 36951]KAF2165158.1 hypothetical protein M409DRAFT_56040 [Zasmidium cellare ATCC 36951]